MFGRLYSIVIVCVLIICGFPDCSSAEKHGWDPESETGFCDVAESSIVKKNEYTAKSQTFPCEFCSCKNGVITCQPHKCSDPQCKEGEEWQKESVNCCLSCMSKSSKRTCEYNGKLWHEGSRWRLSSQPCEECRCQDGNVSCAFLDAECNKKNCSSIEPRNSEISDHACLVPMKSLCTYKQTTFPSRYVWFPLDCVACMCENGTTECYVVDCPSPLLCTKEERFQTIVEKCCSSCTRKQCIQDMHIHTDGEQWKIDNCTYCACKDGRIYCEQVQCPDRNSHKCNKGEDLITRPGECCPSCTSNLAPCIHNRTTYFSGDIWNSKECEYCSCNNGKITCRPIICYPTLCPQGQKLIQPKHKCCPECVQDTDICLEGKQIYEQGDVVRQEGCYLTICYKGNLVRFVNDNCKQDGINKHFCQNGVIHNGICKDQCPDGFYSFLNHCKACAAGCLNCFSGENHQCIKCAHHLINHHGQCLPSCPSGFIAINGSCRACDSSCKMCAGPSEKQCTSCKIIGQVLDGGQCVDECRTSLSYVQNDQCFKCSSSCNSCSSEAPRCRSCKDGYYLQNGKCQPSCDKGHFTSSNKVCFACHPSCKECTGPLPSECISCHANDKLLFGSCVRDCGQGFYLDSSLAVCKACHSSCATCIGPSNDECLMCADGFLMIKQSNLHHGTCFDTCPDHFYANLDIGTCEACHPSCGNCVGPFPENCTACPSSLLLVMSKGLCVQSCDDGYYQYGNTCDVCHKSCAQCHGWGSDKCLSCHVGGQLETGHCVYPCEDGFYSDSNGMCKECHPSCSTCLKSHMDKTPTICLKCKPPLHPQGQMCTPKCHKGYFLNKHGICEECHSSCASCTGIGPFNCSECFPPMIQTHTGMCSNQCSKGFFNMKGTCHACDPNCLDCTSDGRCEKCKGRMVLQFGKCVDACEERYFLNSVTRKCQTCSWRCNTCHGPTFRDCLSCMSRMFLERGVCVVKCSSGFYPDGKYCRACNPECRTCKDHNSCTSCKAPLFQLKGECVRNCGSGRYPDSKTSICKRCPSNCLYCESQANCESCKEGYYFSNGMCVTSCGQGYFESKEKRLCEENLTGPQVLLHKPVVVWSGEFVPLGNEVLTVVDPDTEQTDLTVRVVQQPFAVDIVLCEYNRTYTRILKSGDTFKIADIERGKLGLHYSGKSTGTKDVFSIKADDRQLESSVINIPVHIISRNGPSIVQSTFPVVARSGNADIAVQLQNLDEENHDSDIKFTIIAGPKHGFLYNISNSMKVEWFLISDLIEGRIHYAHDGSDSENDMALIQARGRYVVKNKILNFHIVTTKVEVSSALPEHFKSITFDILNHQEATTIFTHPQSIHVPSLSVTPASNFDSGSIVFFSKEKHYTDEESGIVEVEVIRISADLSHPSFVWCSTHSTDPPSALPGKDFVPIFLKISFSPGQTRAICPVTILDDSADPRLEGNETLTVTLSNPSGSELQNPVNSIIIINDTLSDVPIMEFLINEMHVAEADERVDIPVIRRGDISFETSVRCFTQAKSAKVVKDFNERPNTEESVVYFFPQEEIKNCTVQIVNDKKYEEKEIFLVHLGSPHSTKSVQPILGNIDTVTVIISNEDDAPRIQFEKSIYSVPEPQRLGEITRATLKIVRTGDNQKTCKFRVSTQDGTALSGVDYHAKSQILIFEPKQTRIEFEVEILHQEKRAWNKMFTVVLGPGEPINAEVGDVPVAAIHILDHEVAGGMLLPAPPVVVSLLFYDNVNAGITVNPSPGYPLVCVTPCDSHHPEFSLMDSICKKTGITNSTLIHFSWEVAVPEDEHGIQTPFQKIVDNTLFTSVNQQVLDSIYFRQHFRIRCIAQPKDLIGNLGVPLQSKAVIIGQKNGICRAGQSQSGVLHSQPFVATINYVNSSQSNDHNKLKIHIEIPHQDGMLPLISTVPIHNIPLLLSSAIYRQQHSCSNFLVNFDSYSFLYDNVSVPDLMQQSGFQRPYQLNRELRGTDTVSLYKHLDLQRCLWTFEATYHMHELVDNCGGSVFTNFQVRDTTVKYVTVHVPLFISYVYVTAPTGWASADHRTEMEFAFYYNSVLGQNGLETSGLLRAEIQVVRILVNSDGRLVVEFKTEAKFRGIFVLKHRSLPSEKAQMFSVEHPDLTFDLQLVWSQDTFDGPTQIWKATSKYNLKDYTGTYIIDLIPCTVTTTHSYLSVPNKEPLCTAHKPKRFKVPISFQQSSRPVPAIYSLNSIFQLLNSKELFLSDPTEYHPQEIVYTGTFTKGQIVYGRVLWHPDQDLKSAYRLQIDRVYLCTGIDGYIPTFDPTGSEYGEGPKFGCIKPSRELKYRFLLLDRYSNEMTDTHFYNIPFQASFSTALQKMNGMDGFHFVVDALYKVESGHEWYLQVIYTILPSSHKIRKRRFISQGNVSHLRETFRTSSMRRNKNVTSKYNGTNMCMLQLLKKEDSSLRNISSDQRSAQSSAFSFVISIPILITILIFVVILHHYWRKRHRHEEELCNKQNRTNSQKVVQMKKHSSREQSTNQSTCSCKKLNAQKRKNACRKNNVHRVIKNVHDMPQILNDSMMDCTEV